MQNCLVEINRGNIFVYSLSSTSLEKETIYFKSFKYYKEINELLISRYIRNIISILSEVIHLPELKNRNSEIKVNIVLENNKEVISALRKYFINRKNFKLEIIDKRKYKSEMYRKLSRGVINVWEVGGYIYFGHYRKNMRLVYGVLDTFNNKGVTKQKIIQLIYCCDFPNMQDIDLIKVDIEDSKLKDLLLDIILTMGYNS